MVGRMVEHNREDARGGHQIPRTHVELKLQEAATREGIRYDDDALHERAGARRGVPDQDGEGEVRDQCVASDLDAVHGAVLGPRVRVKPHQRGQSDNSQLMMINGSTSDQKIEERRSRGLGKAYEAEVGLNARLDVVPAELGLARTDP